MQLTTAHILEGLRLKKIATEQGRDEDAVLIDKKLTDLIDSLNMIQLTDLATVLQERGIVDFGYPQKIITPLPHSKGFFSWVGGFFKSEN
jgi:hypothetical protein